MQYCSKHINLWPAQLTVLQEKLKLCGRNSARKPSYQCTVQQFFRRTLQEENVDHSKGIVELQQDYSAYLTACDDHYHLRSHTCGDATTEIVLISVEAQSRWQNRVSWWLTIKRSDNNPTTEEIKEKNQRRMVTMNEHIKRVGCFCQSSRTGKSFKL